MNAFEKIKEQFEFRKSYLSYNGLVVSVPIITFENAIEIVNQVAEEYGTDINVGSNDGWIPCSERLPEEKGEYYVTYHPCYWNNVYDEVCVGLDTFRGKTSWAQNKYQRVIAWKPKDAPYQPKGENNV